MQKHDLAPILFLFSVFLYIGVTVTLEGTAIFTGGYSYSCPTDSAPCNNPYYMDTTDPRTDTQKKALCKRYPYLCGVETIPAGTTLGKQYGPLTQNANDVITILSVPFVVYVGLLYLEKKQFLRVI